MVAMRFTVTAERGTGPVWVLQCAEHPGAISQTRRLREAGRLMAEAISFVAGANPEEVEIDLVPVLPEPLAARVAAARRSALELAAAQRSAAAASRRAARELVAAGLSGADTARVLGVSAQRVSQLLAAPHEAA